MYIFIEHIPITSNISQKIAKANICQFHYPNTAIYLEVHNVIYWDAAHDRDVAHSWQPLHNQMYT